jgi:hypothetical protein
MTSVCVLVPQGGGGGGGAETGPLTHSSMSKIGEARPDCSEGLDTHEGMQHNPGNTC